MENLTKQQIVLLTLLVSFVTSIATGIVTVTLMDQAPPAFTQTVNRIVERTIEKAVPVPTQSAAVVQNQTVIIKEDSLVTSAIENNKNNIVKISAIGLDSFEETFLGLGTVVSADGVIATDVAVISGNNNFLITFGDGAVLSAKAISVSESRKTALLKVADSVSATSTLPTKKPRKFSAATLGNSDALKLGQSVIAIGGQNLNNVASGIISGFSVSEVSSNSSSTPSVRNGIDTSLVLRGSGEGSPLLDLDGNTVAIRTGMGSDAVYIPINLVKSQLASALSATTTASN